MFKINKIDHVAFCVADLDEAAARWKALFGISAGQREFVQSQGTDVLPLPIGDSSIELISPHGNESLARFLDKKGPGLHHIAIEVTGIEDAVVALKALGVAMIDQVPRRGARGHKVAFVHPKATGGVLVELVEPEISAPPSR